MKNNFKKHKKKVMKNLNENNIANFRKSQHLNFK